MTGYLVAAIVLAGALTLALRAVPFAMLKPLRKSRFVRRLGEWMPAGILLILAVVVLRNEFLVRGAHWWIAAVATAVTIGVHLLGGRRVLLSVAAGTATYILLVNLR